jgi:hypothetical protein
LFSISSLPNFNQVLTSQEVWGWWKLTSWDLPCRGLFESEQQSTRTVIIRSRKKWQLRCGDESVPNTMIDSQLGLRQWGLQMII